MPDAKAVGCRKLRESLNNTETFKKAFPKDKDPVTYNNLASAIESFDNIPLITHDRLTVFSGRCKALTKNEIAGLKTFMDTGCTTCHNGALIGGNSYRKLGGS